MPSMKISMADVTPTPTPSCHGVPPQVGGATLKVGCYEQCTNTDPTTGSPIGDYLHISGAMYEEISTTSQMIKTHNNNYYCGEGLANKENRVTVELPGPVTVRSKHFLSEYIIILILLFPALVLMICPPRLTFSRKTWLGWAGN